MNVYSAINESTVYLAARMGPGKELIYAGIDKQFGAWAKSEVVFMFKRRTSHLWGHTRYGSVKYILNTTRNLQFEDWRPIAPYEK